MSVSRRQNRELLGAQSSSSSCGCLDVVGGYNGTFPDDVRETCWLFDDGQEVDRPRIPTESNAVLPEELLERCVTELTRIPHPDGI